MQEIKTIQVSFNISAIPLEEEKLIALLNNIGFDSFWQDDSILHAYIRADIFKSINLNDILTENFNASSPPYELIEMENKNWNEVWEKNYKPVIIEDQIYIYAPFHKKEEKFPYSILIEPKMSFGTAHHGTTAAMLSFLLEKNLKGKTVIDAGCGTGILGIFALMKGAKEVYAYDNDPWAVENAKENFARNISTKTIVELGEAELLKGKTCDIFLANIHKNVIINEIPAYSKTLDSGGLLFLSGFYKKDLDDIKKTCKKNGLLFEKYKEKDGWIAAAFVKERL